MHKSLKIIDFLESLPFDFKKPYYFQDHLEVKRLLLSSPLTTSPLPPGSTPLYFLWARTSPTYKEDSMQSLNKNPYNLLIFKEIKDGGDPDSLFLLMEHLSGSMNLITLLEKSLNLLEITNLMFQLIDTFKLSANEINDIPFIIYPYQFYLQGSRLKTDIFISLLRRHQPIMKGFQEEEFVLKAKNKESAKREINSIYFLGIIFFKLLTNNKETLLNKAGKFKIKHLKGFNISNDLAVILKKMLNINENYDSKTFSFTGLLAELERELKDFYKRHYISEIGFLSKEYNCKEIRLFTIEIHKLLLSIEIDLEKEDFEFVKISLILAYFAMFFRKLIVKVIGFNEKYSWELSQWIEIVDKENQKLEEKFLVYYDIAEEVYKENGVLKEIFEGELRIKRNFSGNLIEMQEFYKRNREFIREKIKASKDWEGFIKKLCYFLRI